MTTTQEPQPAPIDDETRAREIARVAVLRIVVTLLGAILVVLAIVVFSTLILRAVKGGGKPGTERPAAAADAPSSQMPPFAASGRLPEGARVVSTALGEGRLAVTVEAGGTLTTILFDLATGAETGRITLARP